MPQETDRTDAANVRGVAVGVNGNDSKFGRIANDRGARGIYAAGPTKILRVGEGPPREVRVLCSVAVRIPARGGQRGSYETRGSRGPCAERVGGAWLVREVGEMKREKEENAVLFDRVTTSGYAY